MANQITLRGFVSSAIDTSTLDTGLVVGSFRMGSNIRKLDPVTNQWVDGPTSWFRVNMFRSLASNTMLSIHKGDRILIVGKLKVTSYLRKDGNPGTGVEIDADSIGPDLQFGRATYHRGNGLRVVGLEDSHHDDGASYESRVQSGAPGTSDHPDAETADPEGNGDDANFNNIHGAAMDDADPEGNDGLDEGEQADKETGEIVEAKAAF